MILQEVDGVRYIPEAGSIVIESYGERQRLFLDENARDFCVGVYGDGCGGGRVFVLYASYVKAYDLEGGEVMIIEALEDARHISKKGCLLSIQTGVRTLEFNLSTMRKEGK